jgi:phosphoglycolate phosphatase-like HAD superfamily hydrolase
MNTTINRAVFLDFDGVLFDTVREVYAVSMIALDRSVRITDINFGSKHFEKFNRLRYLVGSAWNYYYIIQAIDKESLDSTSDIENEYKNLLNQRMQEEHSSFEKFFFQTRNQLRDKEHDHWLSMVKPYSIVKNLRKIITAFQDQFFLVTTRDQESVEDLLNLHNLNILESNIFAKTEYALHNSKAHIIQNLIDKHQIEESLFIDDLGEHLLACSTIESLYTIQAKWGYVVPEKKEDNSVFLLKELERFIHGENVRA